MTRVRSTRRLSALRSAASAAAALLWSMLPTAAAAGEPEKPGTPPAPARSPFDEVPLELKGVDIIEHVDAKLPLELSFTDDTGRQVKLGDYFKGERPVILTLNYYRCAGLCTFTLNGMVDVVRGLAPPDGNWAMPGQYEIVTVSIDPKEEWELAHDKKATYMIALDRKGAPENEQAGWHFLVGAQEEITKLTQTVGFNYIPQDDGTIAHAAVVILCTPDGRVSRYVYGIQPPLKDARLALIEASEGKVGSAFDRFILWCHRYDPDSKSYVKSAMRLMQLGGVVTLVVMGVGLGILWRMDLRGRAIASEHVHGGPASAAPVAQGGLQT